jgi:hypothetical protein
MPKVVIISYASNDFDCEIHDTLVPIWKIGKEYFPISQFFVDALKLIYRRDRSGGVSRA